MTLPARLQGSPKQPTYFCQDATQEVGVGGTM